MSPAHRTGSNRAPRKEAFYVRVVLPDGGSQYLPATDYIGREMPFDKPRETCAVRIYDDVVAFSMLHLSKKRAGALAGKPVAMPSGMLTRLSRRALELGALEPGQVVVEREDALYHLKLDIDANKVAHIDTEQETTVEMDPRGERLSLYLASPVRGKVLALAFIGHLGKPGTPETVTRLAAKVLNAALGLPAFQVLADLETVVVPSKPGSSAMTVEIRSMNLELPVQLFTDPAPGENPAPVGSGSVVVELDLEHANASSERLLFTLHPDTALAPHFETYRDICNRFVSSQIPLALGDELRSITYDIVLGEVEASTVERLREKLAPALAGVDLTPTLCRARA